MTLTELMHRYSRAQQNRSAGGLRALSGFDFQLRCYLAEFVEGLVAADEISTAGDSFSGALEALSDYTASSPDGLICVQAKRTLTSTAMAAAAVEFAVIEDFLQSETGDHPIVQPQFRVIGHQTQLDADWSWSNVVLPSKVVMKRPELKSVWQSLIDTGRLDSPRVEPDPWWRLIAATFHRLDGPFEFARTSLDLCLQRHETSAGQVRDAIAELFTKHLAQKNVGNARAVTAPDFQPDDETRWEPLRVGFRPSLALLRNGQFMLRERYIPQAVESLDRLQEDQAFGNVVGLPVLWVSGPSGCGKSVLLLQMMESLTRDGASIVWLDDDAGRLAPLLNTLCDERDLDSRDLPDLIFIDDLYAPQNQQRLDLPELQRLIGSRPFDHWPVVVTCGPPEFHDRLDRESHGVLHMASWTLPRVRIQSSQPDETAEADVFTNWYQQRTGEAASRGTAFEGEKGLMISMAYELRFEQGPSALGPFATRFRDRLKADGLDEKLTLPLALNRLYLWTPADWLDESARERLDEINRHKDFSVFELHGGGELLRLTHPHISDAIYRALRDPGSPRAYANDLAEALKRAATSHAGTLRLLLRSLSSDDPRIADRVASVDIEHLVQSVTRDWNHADVESRLQASEIADVRTSWACWHARQQELGIEDRLGRPLLDAARETLRHAGSSWSYLWQRLRTAYPGSSALLRDAVEWLHEPTSETSRGWSFIWEDVWGQQINRESQVDPATLARCAGGWLRRQWDQADWHFVWTKLVHQTPLPHPAPPHDEIVELGWQWLLDRSNASERQTTSHTDRAAWAYVWQDLLAQPRFESAQARVALLTHGFQWLTDREERTEWTHVWRKLVETPDLPDEIPRDALLTRGFQWLTDREERSEWAHVWRKLVATCKLPDAIPRDALLTRGFQWLTDREERSEWTFIWQMLVETQGHFGAVPRDALLTRGRHWLLQAAHRDRPEWDKLFEGWIEAGGYDSELLSAGAEWVAAHLDQRQVPPLAAKVLRAAREFAEFDELAAWLADWCQAHPEDGRTKFVMGYLGSEQSSGWNPATNTAGWAALLEWLGPPIKRIDEAAALALQEKQKAVERVYGRIDQRVEKGFLVMLREPEATAFLPGSQVDLRKPTDWDAYLGIECEFGIEQVTREPSGWSIIVSRRSVLEAEREALFDLRLSQLKPGDRVQGTVRNVVDFGAFIDIGGIDGLLHKSEMAWEKVTDPSAYCAIADVLELVILSVDIDARKVTLSRKAVLPNPWEAAVSELQPGSEVTVVVRNLVGYGAFVELDSGISGLLHVSNISWTRRLSHPEEYLSIGQELHCQVLRINSEKQHLELGLKQLTPDPWLDRIPQEYPPGIHVAGHVAKVTPFGVFVELEPDLDGLLHISEIPSIPTDLDSQFQLGQEVKVRILGVDAAEQKIGLSLYLDGNTPRDEPIVEQPGSNE